MIDWDEVLEDIDWKRGVAFIAGGILIIGAFIFVLLDYHRYSTMKTALEHDLEIISDFQNNWKAPGAARLNELREEQVSWGEKLAGVERLPKDLDSDDLASRVKELAAQNRVEITRLNQLPAAPDGYCMIVPIEVIFSSRVPAASGRFLSDVARMPEPHSVKSQPITLGGTNQITIEFYAFDEEGWNEINNCDVKLTVPDIPYREIEGIRIFQSSIKNLQSKVDQESANLADVKREFTESCQLEVAVGRLRTEYEIIQEKL